MNLREKLTEAHKSRPTLTVAVLGGFTALTLMFAGFGVEIAFADSHESLFKVCDAIGKDSPMAKNIRRLMTFLIAAVFGGGTLLAAIEHAKMVLGIDDSAKKLWNNDTIKGAVGFPLGLYFIDFGLGLVFKVNVACLFPWGG